MLFGRFALIFYLNFEHGLFVYILKQRKKFRRFYKKTLDFEKKLKNLQKQKTFNTIFLILIIH